jgi:cellulose synthase/poly-beta-1,6-N-acetylglucosamine synthase-like glycosyltransferase
LIQIDTSPLTLFFMLFGLGYIVALAYTVIFDRRRRTEEGEDTSHLFSLMIPARNEEKVIASTVRALLALDYPLVRFEILVIDHGSSDLTAERTREAAAGAGVRVEVLRVPKESSGRGKGEALNAGLRHLRAVSPFRRGPRWVIGVFDADGIPDLDLLKKASHALLAPRVAGVQATVRIRNRGASWLASMQEVEFAGFARMTQTIRMSLADASSLGGNGQFVRASTLESAALEPGATWWDPGALTEDLELTARLALRNWDIRHLNTSAVWQEGVERTRGLLKQRVRWAWGSLQVFVDYVLKGRVFRARRVRMGKRFDLLLHLSMLVVSPLVLVTWLITAIGFAGLAVLVNPFPAPLLVLLSFAYLPIVGYGLATLPGYPRRRTLLDVMLFALYTYHWIPCLYAAMWHMIAGHRPVWFKTAKGNAAADAGGG